MDGLEIDDKTKELLVEFIKLCCHYLKINKKSIIYIVSNRKKYKIKTLGFFENDKIFIYGKNRLLADILRTISHELKHFSQSIKGILTPDSGKTGSPEENDANIFSGNIMRIYGKKRPLIYKV